VAGEPRKKKVKKKHPSPGEKGNCESLKEDAGPKRNMKEKTVRKPHCQGRGGATGKRQKKALNGGEKSEF